MNITNVKIHKLENSKTLALATITIGGDFVVNGLKIFTGKNGLFVSMPSRKKQDGEYVDIAHAISKDAYETIQEQVLKKFYEQDVAPQVEPPVKNERQQRYDSIEVNEDDLPF